MTYLAETRIHTVDPHMPDPNIIQAAADLLHAGRLVAFPTETVYGLGANALDSQAIGRIYAAKQRPATDPIIVHIHTQAQLNQLAVEVPPSAYKLAARFWPGPLTLVLKRAPQVPANIATGLNSIAIRMPAHPVAVALLKAAALPIAAPSANTFTRPSATTAAHVLQDLQGRVDMVLDAGPATIGLESTVLSLLDSEPMVLRPGGIPIEALREVLPGLRMRPRYAMIDENMSAPGQMLKHYSPHARVMLFSGPPGAVITAMQQAARQYDSHKVGVLAADEDCQHFEALAIVRPLGALHDLDGIGRNLFAAMRDLDAHDVSVMLVRDFGREGVGAALWDRLLRAAEGVVIAVPES